MNPTREGYTFKGWDKDFTNVTSDLIVTAMYETKKYTITLDSKGGSSVEAIVGDYGTNMLLPIPIKEGYEFVGWYNINGTQYTSDSKIYTDLQLYAEWRKKIYNVTFVDFDDSIIYIQKVEHGANALFPYEPKKQGYTFKGWDKDLSNIINDVIVKAKYENIQV